MKKLINFVTFSIIFSTLFGACSTSDDNEDDKKKVISKIITKYLDYDGIKEVEVTETNTFVYNSNNEVIKIEVSEDFCGNFIYEDSKIISSYGCISPDEKTVFSYSGNTLIKTTSDEVVNEFFYDSDKLKEVKFSTISDNFTKKYSNKYYFSGNNVALTSEDVFWNSEPTIIEYEYDNKNNPFKNHNLYLKLAWGAAFLGENNAVEEISGDVVIKYTIIYDSDDFPIKVTGINQKNGKLRTEYTYQYIKI